MEFQKCPFCCMWLFKKNVIKYLYFWLCHFPLDNLKSRSWSFECLSCICPGFEVLQKLLVSHIHLPQIYGALAALLIGKSDFQVPAGQVVLTLPNYLMWQNVFYWTVYLFVMVKWPTPLSVLWMAGWYWCDASEFDWQLQWIWGLSTMCRCSLCPFRVD